MKPNRLLLSCLLTAGLAAPWDARAQGVPADLAARLIVAVADGDFAVESYQTGALPPAVAGHRDALVVIRRDGEAWRTAVLPGISNSVVAPPEVLALSPEGRFAYVAEMLGERREGATHRRDLSPGRRVTVVDLSDPEHPRRTGGVELEDAPESIRISPDGRTLALSLSGGARERIALVPVEGSILGSPLYFDLTTLLPSGAEGLTRASMDATAVEWHPSGNVLAVNLDRQDAVILLRLQRDGAGAISGLTPWGSPIMVGRDPFVGRFLPDGRHYLTADWRRDFGASDLAGRLPTRPSTLTLVRLDDGGAHRVIATTEGDRSSEGFAVSPDGRWAATLNMRETALPTDHPRHVPDFSVVLFRLDPAAGRVERVSVGYLPGILPEGIAFDAASKYLVGTVFQYADRAGGGLEFWRIAEEGVGSASLVHAGSVTGSHGIHHVELAR